LRSRPVLDNDVLELGCCHGDVGAVVLLAGDVGEAVEFCGHGRGGEKRCGEEVLELHVVVFVGV